MFLPETDAKQRFNKFSVAASTAAQKTASERKSWHWLYFAEESRQNTERMARSEADLQRTIAQSRQKTCSGNVELRPYPVCTVCFGKRGVGFTFFHKITFSCSPLTAPLFMRTRLIRDWFDNIVVSAYLNSRN